MRIALREARSALWEENLRAVAKAQHVALNRLRATKSAPAQVTPAALLKATPSGSIRGVAERLVLDRTGSVTVGSDLPAASTSARSARFCQLFTHDPFDSPPRRFNQSPVSRRGDTELSGLAPFDDSIVLTVVADPEPHQIATALDRQGSVVPRHPHRPESLDSLELQGRMRGIRFQKLVLLVCQSADFRRQLVVSPPET